MGIEHEVHLRCTHHVAVTRGPHVYTSHSARYVATSGPGSTFLPIEASKTVQEGPESLNDPSQMPEKASR
eukprot:437566-Pyramimonas_sp.AAC.1